MKTFKKILKNASCFALLSTLSISSAFALTIIDDVRREGSSDDTIKVEFYVPGSVAMEDQYINAPRSCDGRIGGWIMSVDIRSTQSAGGGQFATGVSTDNPPQYVCIKFIDWRSGGENAWYTNPVKDVPECKIWVEEIYWADSNNAKPKARATPECGFAGTGF